VAIALAFFAALAGPAAAATWTDHQLPSVGQSPLYDISCPSTSLCVAVGGGNTLAGSTNPTGPADGWSVIYPGGAGPPNQSGIKGVSCPSPQLCVAVSFEGFVLTSTNPTGGIGAWSVADLSPSGPNTHLYGISCPSPIFCVASAGGAKVLTSTNPTGGPTAWTFTKLAGPLELRGISCVSASFCVAVGDSGENIQPGPADRGEILTSTDPLGGAWQQVEGPGVPGNLFGVSCPSPTLCVTGNALGNLLVSISPTGPATSWPATPGGASVQLTAAECPTVTRCIAVDNNADVLTSTNPTGGPTAWTFTNLIPYAQTVGTLVSNAMWGASCPTVAFCAISSGDGQVFTSEDPFSTSPVPVKGGAKIHKKRRRKGPKRPRTTLARRPFRAMEIKGRKLTVRFGFFATKHASVRGFQCKIDKRPLARCHSPKRYRVGVGRHRFRVWAIGWSGLKGPPMLASFRVCHPPSPPPLLPGPPCSHSSH
jgi:hypothetical protein